MKNNRSLIAVPATLAISLAGLFSISNAASASIPAALDSGTASCTTDSNGYCDGPTLPFMPNAVILTVQEVSGASTVPSQAIAKITPSSFRARFFTPSGSKAALTSVTYSYLATKGPASTPTPTPTGTPTATPSPTPPPTAPPTAPPTTPSASSPSRVLNLTNWKVTLPVDTSHAGSPDEYTQPELNTFTADPYFKVNAAANGVDFQAAAGGATTGGSSYPRSELREMTSNGSQPASWSNTSGTHTMVVDEALTAMTLVKKPQVVMAQIHDSSSDVIEVLADKLGSRANADGSFGICVRLNGSEQSTCLDSHYVLGTRFVVKMVASGGHIKISYNGIQKFDFAQSGSGMYFKAGSYVQSNSTTKGFDAAQAYGRVTIYGLQVTHS